MNSPALPHPNRRWLRWLAIGIAVVVALALTQRWLSARGAAQAKTAAAPAATPTLELAASDVSPARVQTLTQGLTISGTLKAVSSAVIKARVAGELQGLTLREGDSVQAGQTIGRIDSTESRARLRAAMDQADAAKAQIDIAQRQFDNNSALVNQGFISKTALDTSQANLNAARATHQAAMANADVARKSLQDTVLTSPISGVVSLRSAQPGERVGIDARVLEVMDLRQLELEAAVSAADAVQVRVGQRATLSIEGSASSKAQTQPIIATVVRINPNAQAGSRSVLVYLSVDNLPGNALKAGLFAQGSIGTAEVNALAVPLTSVRTDQPAPYVQVVENQQVVHKPVTLGARGEAVAPANALTSTEGIGTRNSTPMVAVTGLTEGAQVIGSSVGVLQAGTAVKFTGAPAPAAQAAATAGR
ncbi:MAG: efflux RND transporter periplasmic adaptor subunit [Burkholderiaceae bacterium]